MPDERGRRDSPSEAALLAKYSLVEQSWTFLQGIRFALIAFAATLVTALVGSFQVTVTGMQKAPSEGLGVRAPVLILALGLVSTLAIVVLERRLRLMYAACSKRGRNIERRLGIHDGLFQKLHDVPSPFHPITHSHLIYVVFGLVVVSWIVLGIVALSI